MLTAMNDWIAIAFTTLGAGAAGSLITAYGTQTGSPWRRPARQLNLAFPLAALVWLVPHAAASATGAATATTASARYLRIPRIPNGCSLPRVRSLAPMTLYA